MNRSTHLFVAVLFTVSKIWKQPKCPSADEWIKQLCDIYTVEYYLTIKKEKKRKFYLFDSKDGPGEHYAKYNKTVRERQISYGFTYMWNLKNKINK